MGGEAEGDTWPGEGKIHAGMFYKYMLACIGNTCRHVLKYMQACIGSTSRHVFAVYGGMF